MKAGDFLMKKWCFGVSYSRPKSFVEQSGDGSANIVQRYPRYRTIVLEVLDAKKKKGNLWEAEVNQYASLTAKPKKIKVSLKEKKGGDFVIAGQKKSFHKIKLASEEISGMPPVGSLITLNKKHAIVTEVARNELTVWTNNKYERVSVVPGSVRWKSDKIIASIAGTNR
jgi:hypothetical protein